MTTVVSSASAFSITTTSDITSDITSDLRSVNKIVVEMAARLTSSVVITVSYFSASLSMKAFSSCAAELKEISSPHSEEDIVDSAICDRVRSCSEGFALWRRCCVFNSDV